MSDDNQTTYDYYLRGYLRGAVEAQISAPHGGDSLLAFTLGVNDGKKGVLLTKSNFEGSMKRQIA